MTYVHSLPCTNKTITCIHQQCCTKRESVFYRQFRTPRSPIAQSGSKIAYLYHFQVDYELCACDILFSSLKMRECPPVVYSMIFNMYTQLEKNNKNTGIAGGVTNN